MIKLLEIEWLKYKSYNAYWVLIILFIGLQTLVLYGMDSFMLNISGKQNGQTINMGMLGVNTFPKVWIYYSYIAGFFKIIPAVIVIMLLCNEFEFRTFRQQIIDGLSRSQVITAKLLTVVVLTLLSGFVLTALVLLFSADLAEEQSLTENVEFVAAYMLQNLGYLSLAFITALILRKTGLTIIILLLYGFIIEPILVYKLPDIGPYFPLETFGLLIRSPFTSVVGTELQSSIDLSIAGRGLMYVGLLWFAAYYKVNRTDY